MNYESERKACEAWIGGFHAIPTTLLERAYRDEPDALALVAGGDRLSDCCYETVNDVADGDSGEVVVRCSDCHEECETHWSGGEHAWLSPHPWLYHPNEPLDARWVRDHADEIADTCGLLVYESDEAGVLLAVDGGGYDFYRDHWLPLYRLRGLEWHK